MMVEAGLGLDPWNVLNNGLSLLTGLTIGQLSILIGAIVMAMWIPLRQRPGVGTILNVLLIGLSVDATLTLLPTPTGVSARVGYLVAGVVLNGFANAAYIGAGLGVGPRDGLMTGLSERFGWSIRVARIVIEVSVLAIGWLLGGVVGIGTAIYALAIGPLVQAFLPALTIRRPTRPDQWSR